VKINENIAYAKSILKKSGITQDSEEYKDYISIRKICGDNNGYVGILTRIRFIDGINDMDELESIFDVLKNSKMDVGKLTKLSYDEILDLFYQELGNKKDQTDYELYFRDNQYSYYKVYTYNGILKLGSPTWCLKTKSKWDEYQSVYPEQWVVIDNRYVGKLLTPDTNYLTKYNSKGWVRYGISIKKSDDKFSWVGNCDNNGTVSFQPESWTFYGVLCTVINLTQSNKKSYYESFKGCEEFNKNWLKVIDKKGFCERLSISENTFSDKEDVYVSFSKSYSYIPGILTLNEWSCKLLFPVKLKPSNSSAYESVSLVSGHRAILEYANKSDSQLYFGIKLKNNLITMDDIKSDKSFVKQIDNWLIFDRNDNKYLIVNTIPNSEFEIQTEMLDKDNCELKENPMYWYIEKKTFKPCLPSNIIETFYPKIKDYHKPVIEYLKSKDYKETKTIVSEPKKVKGFFDFIKRK
jgi:hypothetical protein